MGRDKPRQRGGKKPSGGDARLAAPSSAGTPEHDRDRMVFCFNCQQSGYSLDELDTVGREKVVMALHKRRTMTWHQFMMGDRTGFGSEWLRISSMSVSAPHGFEDRERFLGFRYNPPLRIVGARVDNVFHILWIAANIKQLYDHGS